MTPQRFDSLLAGQTAIVKKVFEVVPIQDSWTAARIIAELEAVTRSRLDGKTVSGCLSRLKESGLIREPERGRFQRVQVRERIESPKAGYVVDVVALPAEVPVAPSGDNEFGAVGLLAGVAVGLRQMGLDFQAHCERIASEVETAALVLDEAIATTADAAAKWRRFHEMVKDTM